MVGSERALSEVDGVRLMVSVKVGRLPPLPETLSSTAMPRTLSQKGYAHDFDCDHFKYQCSNAPETLRDLEKTPENSRSDRKSPRHGSRTSQGRIGDSASLSEPESRTAMADPSLKRE